MIRDDAVRDAVLNLFRKMPTLYIPMSLEQALPCVPNCVLMSYQEAAEISGHSVLDIARMNSSNDGCTHYDRLKDRYLILYNNDDRVDARKRWTKAHELGHILLEHFQSVPDGVDVEREADAFAARFLCHPAICRAREVTTYQDLKFGFGLSTEAAKFQIGVYVDWLTAQKWTAEEKEVYKLYQKKRRHMRLGNPNLFLQHESGRYD